MSTIEAIRADMEQAGCAPWNVDTFCRSLQHAPPHLQQTFRYRIEGLSETEIAKEIGKSQPRVSVYIKVLKSTLASLLDPSWNA